VQVALHAWFTHASAVIGQAMQLAPPPPHDSAVVPRLHVPVLVQQPFGHGVAQTHWPAEQR
jgi:hypothetical protein